ncbi:hypothetical protein [Pseudomonas sp. JR33AA]|uniref:hypothetical protein n=1 Tax=Pseudomonas sp. JR33AA TaxID=2899113 RepID=UPI001F20FFB4|nr:hypothetical protein [Pseudomonas sp. JR33AA]MCE5976102.1 hypothetical protein [Pseudomonas sp. JR33AA]
MIRPKKHALSTRPVRPFHHALEQQPVAPLDLSYGDKGHGHFTQSGRGNLGSTSSVLRSKVRPARFYVTGHQTDPDGLHSVFIACLDASGKLDTTFNGSGMVDFTTLSTDRYRNATGVVEDVSGNLLVTLEIFGESTTHLWKLIAKGEPDLGFGQGKGYIDTRALFGADLLLDKLACHQEGLVATAARYEAGDFKAVLVALDTNGRRAPEFGENGLLAVSDLIPEGSQHSLEGIAVISPTAGGQRIVICTYMENDSGWYSLTSCLSLAGRLDDTFGEAGHHWSEEGIINTGLTVEDSSQRITSYGQHYSIDDDRSQPTLYRLDYAGEPAREFNQGQVVRFGIDGGWSYIEEAEGGLIGYGGFYTFNMAVRYQSDGQLDTRFVPPHGYGQFGAITPQYGFYTVENPIAVDTENQRIVVSGEDIQQGYRLPCMLALSLRPIQ